MTTKKPDVQTYNAPTLNWKDRLWEIERDLDRGLVVRMHEHAYGEPCNTECVTRSREIEKETVERGHEGAISLVGEEGKGLG